MDIFRPFLPSRGTVPLQTLSSSDSSPSSVFHASFRQLKRLVVSYLQRSQFRHYTGILNPAIMHLCNALLGANTVSISDWRFYFAVCAHFWLDAIPGFPIIADVAQGYLTMGLASGRLSPGEARAWKEGVLARRAKDDNGNSNNSSSNGGSSSNNAEGAGSVQTSVIVDFNGAMDRKEEYRASELAERFEELAVFNELVEVDNAVADVLGCSSDARSEGEAAE